MDDRRRSGIQFERAASPDGDGTVSCASCRRTIPDVYYEAAGTVLCAPCKETALASLQGGSRIVRLVSALGLGTLASVVSAVGWYAITEITGYELGLVAVAVGLLVGGAVRVGSTGRGGWLYQMIAVGLTYAAIATSYVPAAMEGLREQVAQEAAAEDEAALASETVANQADPDAAPAGDRNEIPPAVEEAILWGAALFAAFTWPVLQVTEGGFIGLLIVGFALYEAWKLNKRTTLALAGPFRVGSRPAAPAV